MKIQKVKTYLLLAYPPPIIWIPHRRRAARSRHGRPLAFIICLTFSIFLSLHHTSPKPQPFLQNQLSFTSKNVSLSLLQGTHSPLSEDQKLQKLFCFSIHQPESGNPSTICYNTFAFEFITIA